MSLTRYDFLKLSVWGIVGTLLPIHQLKALSFITDLKTYQKTNYSSASALAALAKEQFYQKNYTEAEDLYLDSISLAPADIRLYDGLQNVYGAQGFSLAIIELYKNGLIANPENVDFYDRAARSIMRLELGNKKVADEYRHQIDSESLLLDAKALYEEALSIAPEKTFLTVGLDKVNHKIDINATEIDYKTNAIEKEARMNRRRAHKARYLNFTKEELQERLQQIDEMERYPLYFQNEIDTRTKNIIREKKVILNLLAKKCRDEENHTESIDYANMIYEIDENDTVILNFLKKAYIKTNNFDSLIDLQRDHHTLKQTYHSHLGLMSALTLKFKKQTQNNVLVDESISLGENILQNWPLLTDHLLIRAVDKLAECYTLRGNYNIAKTTIENTIGDVTTLSEGCINNLLYRYAKIFYENVEYEQAKNILSLGLNIIPVDEVNGFETIKELASKKRDQAFNANLRLYYLLYEVYSSLGDSFQKNQILQKLLANNPQDRFALNRI